MGFIIVRFILSSVNAILAALFFHITWGWFIEPVFEIQSPGWVGSLGIIAMVSFLHYVPSSEIRVILSMDNEETLIHSITRTIMIILVFSIACLISLFL